MLPWCDYFVDPSATEEQVLRVLSSPARKMLRRFSCGMLTNERIVDKLPKEYLTELWIRFAPRFTGINEILKLTRLEKLILAACNSLTDSLVSKLEGLKFLESINLEGNSQLGDEGIIPIVEGCKRLTEINLKRVSITGKTLKAVGENLPKLRSILLSGQCSKSAFLITDEVVIEMLSVCSKVEILHLDFFPSLSLSICEIFKSYKFTELKEIEFKKFLDAETINLKMLQTYCPKLYHLNSKTF